MRRASRQRRMVDHPGLGCIRRRCATCAALRLRSHGGSRHSKVARGGGYYVPLGGHGELDTSEPSRYGKTSLLACNHRDSGQLSKS